MCNLVYIAACSSSRRPFITRIPAWAFNGAFGLFYFALAGAVLGLFTAGEIHWVKIIDAAEDLSDSLKIAAGDWRQGDSVDLSYLLTLTPMVETLEERAESAISIFNASYGTL